MFNWRLRNRRTGMFVVIADLVSEPRWTTDRNRATVFSTIASATPIVKFLCRKHKKLLIEVVR